MRESFRNTVGVRVRVFPGFIFEELVFEQIMYLYNLCVNHEVKLFYIE